VTATADSLRKQLDAGTLTCVEIVQTYLAQIARYNPKICAVIQTAPETVLLERARTLDRDRTSSLGPLHGIPILLKDNIDTNPSLGLGTTCGSLALLHAQPHANAPLVEGLLAAGAIILGKANMSEFAYFLGEGNPCGWSAVGGQTQSVYIKGGFEWSESVGSHNVRFLLSVSL